jgi:hypothetical protein
MENFTEPRAYGLSKTELIYSITAVDGVPSAATLSPRVTHHSRSLPCAACMFDAPAYSSEPSRDYRAECGKFSTWLINISRHVSK